MVLKHGALCEYINESKMNIKDNESKMKYIRRIYEWNDTIIALK